MAEKDIIEWIAGWSAVPRVIAIDAAGYWWRTFGEDPYWSMVPVNPDNSPIPKPVKFYRLVPME